jgi:hypothetical protein
VAGVLGPLWLLPRVTVRLDHKVSSSGTSRVTCWHRAPGASKTVEGSGGGGGGGAFVSPVGYIEVRDGTAEFQRISSAADLLALIAAASLAALAVERLLAG